MKKKIWARAFSHGEEKEEKKEEKKFDVKLAGLSGLEKKVKDEDSKQKEELKQAFSDLDSLMEKAKEMVNKL